MPRTMLVTLTLASVAGCLIEQPDISNPAAIKIPARLQAGTDEKALWVGQHIWTLKPTMRRADVERSIGPPDIIRKFRYAINSNPPIQYMETYYATTPPGDKDEKHRGGIMSIPYEEDSAGDRFIEVLGPHVPGD